MSIDTDLRLSAQRALWGHVPASLRAVSVTHDDHHMRVRSIFDERVSDHDQELLSMVGTQILADFAAPYTMGEEFLIVRPPAAMDHLAHLVYLRYEPESHDY